MLTYALVAAADFNANDFLARYQAGCFDAVIAVDGGYAHLLKADVQPHIVLGDFDSLGYVPNGQRIIRHPEQKDASDLELALAVAQDEGAERLYAYGCLSGRLDHTLTALQTLARASEAGIQVFAVSCGVEDSKAEFDEGCMAAFLSGPARLEFPAGASGGVSVISLNDAVKGVTEEGLFYPLHDARLTNRTSLGLSNQLTGAPAAVSLEEGTVCVLYPRRIDAIRVY